MRTQTGISRRASRKPSGVFGIKLPAKPTTDPAAAMTSRDGQAAIPRGYTLSRDPLLNKGTAFTEAERDALGLRGLLPPHVAAQDEQAIRVIENLRRLPTSLEKHVALTALHDRNETLFFRIAVAGVAYRQGYATTPEPQDLFTFVRSQMYEPKYQGCV